VKVGRAALDQEAIRLLEELNPEVDFDWTRILKGGPAADESRQPGVPARRAGDRTRRGEARRVAEPRGERWGERTAAPVIHPPGRPEAAVGGEPAVEAAEEPRVPESPEEQALPPDVPPTAAHARLGSEGVSRLRGRYAEILARIAERITDEIRREELKSLAERLNPDSWVTDAEVTAGLEAYEGVFESLRAVVGRRRRRRRRGARPREQGAGEQPTQAIATEPGAGDSAPEADDAGPDPDEF
jgi:hypothetical protein